MKTFKKILIISSATILTTAATVGASYLVAHFVSKSFIESNNYFPSGQNNLPQIDKPNRPPLFDYRPLDKTTVQNNFKKGGIWENKTFLTAKDLDSYNYINTDYFDSITKTLDYIELPVIS